VNVIVTGQLGRKVELSQLAKIPQCSYDEGVYRGRVAYIKSMQMKGKVSVFASGKMISVGTTSEADAKRDIKLACQILGKAGFPPSSNLDTRVENIVAHVKVPRMLDLDVLSQRLNHVIYEPEQFPAAIVRFDGFPETTVLAFASGSLVIAGAKSLSVVDSVAEHMASITEITMKARAK
jgi:TATA-box binding protein (TBP) (component of TFIID and TFIIIB)